MIRPQAERSLRGPRSPRHRLVVWLLGAAVLAGAGLAVAGNMAESSAEDDWYACRAENATDQYVDSLDMTDSELAVLDSDVAAGMYEDYLMGVFSGQIPVYGCAIDPMGGRLRVGGFVGAGAAFVALIVALVPGRRDLTGQPPPVPQPPPLP